MERKLEDHSTHLIESFRPEKYAEVIQPMFGEYDFLLQQLHKALSTGKFKGERCLEFGCGPTIHNVAEASAYYNQIVSSDFLEVNREEVQKWLRKDPKAMDWSTALEAVAKLEGFSDVKAGAQIIADRIRSRIKAVVYCDALADRALPKDVKGDFDMVISCLCLEVVASKCEDYKKAVQKVGDLLKPGGVLILMGTLGCTFWGFPGTRLFCFPLTRDIIEEAVKDAGFTDIDWNEYLADASTVTVTPEYPEPIVDGDGFFFLTCVKK